MTAKWTLGGIPIYVSEYENNRDIYRAEIKILDATVNELQFFGSGSRKKKLRGLVVSNNNYSSLEISATTNAAMAFYGPYGLIGTYRISSLSGKNVKFASATIDGDQFDVETGPLFEVDLELIEG